MDQFTFSLERDRTAEGFWLNGRSMLVVEGRKLFGRTRLEISSETSGFHDQTEIAKNDTIEFAGSARGGAE